MPGPVPRRAGAARCVRGGVRVNGAGKPLRGVARAVSVATMVNTMEDQVRAWADAGELELAHQELRARVVASGSTPFVRAAAGGFSTSVDEVRAWLARCASLLAAMYDDIPAFYTEMNGFEINTDRWTASLEAWDGPLTTFGDLGEDGPKDFPLHYEHDLHLRGWESMQEAMRDHAEDPAFLDAVFLVNISYLRLVRDALGAGPIDGITVPVAVTTHATEIGFVVDPS